MKPNAFGERFIVTTFGESHGPGIGCVIEGCPAGMDWNESLLVDLLRRRRPGLHTHGDTPNLEISKVVSARQETDLPEILSGVFEGKTLGTPIAIFVRNRDSKSSDYSVGLLRTGHADDVWQDKFGFRDHRGGGRSSGRETLARVLGGGVALMFLQRIHPGIKVFSFIDQVGPYCLSDQERVLVKAEGLAAEEFPFPSSQRSAVVQLLEQAKKKGESYGGSATLVLENIPRGLGEPVFRKLKSDLAGGMMSLGAACSVEIGEAERAAREPGTQFHRSEISSNYGGLRGGISTGEKIVLRVGFKPTSSILDVAKRGRHDPCIIPRALPVLESMAALVLADQILFRATNRIDFFHARS
jgi:chorismate synthase